MNYFRSASSIKYMCTKFLQVCLLVEVVDQVGHNHRMKWPNYQNILLKVLRDFSPSKINPFYIADILNVAILWNINQSDYRLELLYCYKLLHSKLSDDLHYIGLILCFKCFNIYSLSQVNALRYIPWVKWMWWNVICLKLLSYTCTLWVIHSVIWRMNIDMNMVVIVVIEQMFMINKYEKTINYGPLNITQKTEDWATQTH